MVLGRFSDRNSLAFYVVIGLCLAAFGIFAFANFGNLFLLVEYREWAEPSRYFNFLTIFNPLTIADAQTYSVAHSRALPLAIAPATSIVCGPWPACHNTLQIGLLLGTGFFLAAALRKLFPDAPLTLLAGATLFFLFSEVALDALAWQGTFNDKLSVFFSALGIYAVAHVDLLRLDLRNAIVTNVIVLLIVIAAYNTKEGPFPLVPSMLGLLVLRFLALEPAIARDAVVRAVRNTVTLLAVPTAYGVFHVALVIRNRVFMNPVEAGRVMGGSWTGNLYRDVLYMFSARPWAEWLAAFPYLPQDQINAFVVLCALAVVLVAVLVVRFASRLLQLYWVWALLSFLLAMVIPIRTVSASPFYLLVPVFYLAILLFVTSLAFVRAFPWPIASPVVQAVVGLLVALHVVGFFAGAGPYYHIATMSKNFTAILPQLGAAYERTPRPSRVDFSWPQTEPRTYMFLIAPRRRTLARYVLPKGTSQDELDAFDAAISDKPYAAGAEPHPAPSPGTISVVLGDDLRLLRLIPPSR